MLQIIATPIDLTTSDPFDKSFIDTNAEYHSNSSPDVNSAEIQGKPIEVKGNSLDVKLEIMSEESASRTAPVNRKRKADAIENEQPAPKTKKVTQGRQASKIGLETRNMVSKERQSPYHSKQS